MSENFDEARKDMDDAWQITESAKEGNPEERDYAEDLAKDTAIKYAESTKDMPEALQVDINALDASIEAQLFGESMEMSKEGPELESALENLTKSRHARYPNETMDESGKAVRDAFQRHIERIEKNSSGLSEGEIQKKALQSVFEFVTKGSWVPEVK